MHSDVRQADTFAAVADRVVEVVALATELAAMDRLVAKANVAVATIIRGDVRVTRCRSLLGRCVPAWNGRAGPRWNWAASQ
jgi:hypothetical protein